MIFAHLDNNVKSDPDLETILLLLYTAVLQYYIDDILEPTVLKIYLHMKNFQAQLAQKGV